MTFFQEVLVLLSVMKLRGTLAPGEHVIAATRSHVGSLMPALAAGIGAIAAFSFASALYVDSKIFGVIGYALAIFWAWRCIRRALRWIKTCFFITNLRVVIQRGLSTSTRISLPLTVIEGVDVRVSPMRLGQSAHLHLYVQGDAHVLRSVPRGHAFSQTIYSAQSKSMSTYYPPAGY